MALLIDITNERITNPDTGVSVSTERFLDIKITESASSIRTLQGEALRGSRRLVVWVRPQLDPDLLSDLGQLDWLVNEELPVEIRTY